eukprot:CAMPEP_0185033612 /NCGR_PEP_ID=MMETSP1103-20130426/22705_1 /TAXON_ID=36769 /ORGANISM="Paraphysomonas bandaiensis, Strain Caron Lab Isolate" /LENGTH=649 /DNA_ID=CAMNT_0027569949 /DNA_START=286 /DNA_END=2238 /DNA_ORIENTATION=-
MWVEIIRKIGPRLVCKQEAAYKNILCKIIDKLIPRKVLLSSTAAQWKEWVQNPTEIPAEVLKEEGRICAVVTPSSMSSSVHDPLTPLNSTPQNEMAGTLSRSSDLPTPRLIDMIDSYMSRAFSCLIPNKVTPPARLWRTDDSALGSPVSTSIGDYFVTTCAYFLLLRCKFGEMTFGLSEMRATIWKRVWSDPLVPSPVVEDLEWVAESVGLVCMFVAGKLESCRYYDLESLLRYAFSVRRSGVSVYGGGYNELRSRVVSLEMDLLEQLLFNVHEVPVPIKCVVDWSIAGEIPVDTAKRAANLLASQVYIKAFLGTTLLRKTTTTPPLLPFGPGNMSEKVIALTFVIASVSQHLFTLDGAEDLPANDIKENLFLALVPFPAVSRDESHATEVALELLFQTASDKVDVHRRAVILVKGLVHYSRQHVPPFIVKEYTTFLRNCHRKNDADKVGTDTDSCLKQSVKEDDSKTFHCTKTVEDEKRTGEDIELHPRSESYSGKEGEKDEDASERNHNAEKRKRDKKRKKRKRDTYSPERKHDRKKRTKKSKRRSEASIEGMNRGTDHRKHSRRHRRDHSNRESCRSPIASGIVYTEHRMRVYGTGDHWCNNASCEFGDVFVIDSTSDHDNSHNFPSPRVRLSTFVDNVSAFSGGK